jgi:hypothetical protein
MCKYFSEELQMASKYLEKMFIILCHKQMQIKTTEIPSHPSQNGCHQENTCFWLMWLITVI